jgi:hypothetical protein
MDDVNGNERGNGKKSFLQLKITWLYLIVSQLKTMQIYYDLYFVIWRIEWEKLFLVLKQEVL